MHAAPSPPVGVCLFLLVLSGLFLCFPESSFLSPSRRQTLRLFALLCFLVRALFLKCFRWLILFLPLVAGLVRRGALASAAPQTSLIGLVARAPEFQPLLSEWPLHMAVRVLVVEEVSCSQADSEALVTLFPRWC